MPQDEDKAEKTVTVNAEHYRSLVLAKLRADIAAKQAAIELIADLDPARIQGSGYWKMKYWKMGHIEDQSQVLINPVIGAQPALKPRSD